MVTHRLSEVFEYADRVTVFVDGAVRYTGPVGELTEYQLVEIMVAEPGGAAEQPAPVRVGEPSARSITADGEGGADDIVISGLCTESLRDIALTISPGEMVGIVGGPESGAQEMPLALSGDSAWANGAIEVDGERHPIPSTPREAIARGIALVPRDRLRSGGIGSLSAGENLLLPDTRRYWNRSREARAAIARIYTDFDVHPPSPRVLFRSLSGGNQQKLVIGKWLLRNPRLLILDDPTSGVDPAARQKIFEILEQEIRKGLSVLLLSTEPEQIVEHCSRVIAIDRGRVAREYRGVEVSNATVTGWAAA
jgi:ribose transport system ATP-binding protein